MNRRLNTFCCFLQLSASHVKIESFFGWLGERRRLGPFISVTSLITGESRVIAFESFDVTAECDATVIRDAIVLQKILPCLEEF